MLPENQNHSHTGFGGDGKRVRASDIEGIAAYLSTYKCYSAQINQSSSANVTYTATDINGNVFQPKKVTIIINNSVSTWADSAFAQCNGTAVYSSSGITNRCVSFGRGINGAATEFIALANSSKIVDMQIKTSAVEIDTIQATVTGMTSEGVVTVNWSVVEAQVIGFILIEG